MSVLFYFIYGNLPLTFCYMQIALFISSNDALKPGWLLNYLKGIRPARIKEMQQNLAKVCNSLHVEFNLTDFSFSKIDLCIAFLACLMFDVFLFPFSIQGISCILVQLSHWVLKTWFGKWFATVCFSI